MSHTKHRRAPKRQLGQFLTPPHLAQSLVQGLSLTADTRVFEPCFGDGAFVLPLIEAFWSMYTGTVRERLNAILTRNVYGIEIDRAVYQSCLDGILTRWGYVPEVHNLICADFFKHTL